MVIMIIFFFPIDKKEILHSNFGSTFSLPSTPAETVRDTNEGD